MNKNSKFVFIFIVVYLLFFFAPTLIEEEVITNPFDYARITDVDYKAVLVDEVDNGGKVVITERLTFDVHAAFKNNLFWELWRDLCEDTVDGLKVDYKVNSVKQIYDDGTYLIYEESPKLYWDDYDYISPTYGPGKWYHSKGPYSEYLEQYECVFFYVNGLYREEVVFEIEYEMNNAALRYNDVSELYLSFYSEETINYLESFKGQILIANKDMPRSGNYVVHTYGTNNNDFPFTESDTINPGYHTFLIDLDKDDLKFKPYNEYIEFSLWSYGEDKHIFTEYAPDNLYSDEDVLEELKDEQTEYENVPVEAKKKKIEFLLICMVGTIIILLSILNKDKKIRKKHVFYTPTTEMMYYRDIPSDLDPYFAAELVFSKHKEKKNDANGYSAICLSLVRKGYIELVRINDKKGWILSNIKILIKYKPAPAPVISPTPAPEIQKLRMSEEEIDKLLDVLNMAQIEDEDNIETKNDNNQPAATIQQDTLASQTEDKVMPEYKKYEPLSITEEYYFNLIVRHAFNNEISMSTFQTKVSFDYANTNSFVKNIENSIVNIGISQGYFQKADYKQIKKETEKQAKVLLILGIIVLLLNFKLYTTRLDLAFGALFILGIGLIIGAIYLHRSAKHYVLLTQFGEDEYAKWRGLYEFLNSMTLMNERTVIELPLWEKYLVYATAFGISEKVIKALEIRCPEIDLSTSEVLRNPYYRSTSFRSSSRSFRNATRSASHSSSSGGFRSGSYYGGGGRGGGGGGGGH